MASVSSRLAGQVALVRDPTEDGAVGIVVEVPAPVPMSNTLIAAQPVRLVNLEIEADVRHRSSVAVQRIG